MNSHVWRRMGLLVLVSVVVSALPGCGPKTESVAPQAPGGAVGEVTYTVPASELDNPDNRPVYVCPMKVHRDQVSLDPDARCKLCRMKLAPMEEAEKAWGEGAE